MKVLRGRRRIANAQIVRGAKLQVTLKPRAGMLGTLTLVGMWQQHRQTRSLFPLIFTGSDILVDD